MSLHIAEGFFIQLPLYSSAEWAHACKCPLAVDNWDSHYLKSFHEGPKCDVASIRNLQSKTGGLVFNMQYDCPKCVLSVFHLAQHTVTGRYLRTRVFWSLGLCTCHGTYEIFCALLSSRHIPELMLGQNSRESLQLPKPRLRPWICCISWQTNSNYAWASENVAYNISAFSASYAFEKYQ